MQHEPFGAYVKFRSMGAHVVLQASKETGGGRYELSAEGMMAFTLHNTDTRGAMAVTVSDLRLEFKPTKLTVPGLGPVEIPGFTITRCELDPERTQGTWTRRDRQITLNLALRLDPDHFPIMRQLGFTSPQTVLVTESGTLDWEERQRLETHAEPFQLPAPLDFLTVSPGQFDFCTLSADFYVAANCDMAPELRATEIWICPGDEACLWWRVGGQVTQVTITPDGSTVSAADAKIVTPASTTTYKLHADGLTDDGNKCDKDAQVTVRVVRAGETIFNVTAQWSPFETCIWRFELPAALVGKSVVVQRMRHVKCDGGTFTWPEWAFTHTDPDGNPFADNVRLDTWADITDQPVAGVWRFSPINAPGDCRPPSGQTWEPACFEMELGCR